MIVWEIPHLFQSTLNKESGISFPSEEDCRYYYTCDNGVQTVLRCPLGLVFNETIRACDYPENVDCGEKPQDN